MENNNSVKNDIDKNTVDVNYYIKQKNNNIRKEVLFVILTIFASVLSAFGLHYFVYPANFAPAGIDGVATMLQEKTPLNAGYYSLIFNLPLLVVAWFILKKRYVIYTILFSVLSSILIVVLEVVDFPQYTVQSDKLISAVFSGIILGLRTGIMLKIGASTGGVDVIAGIVQKKRAYGNIERIISIICYVIIGASYFVYGDLNSVLLAIVQMFVFEKSVAVLMKDTRNAVEFKIVTRNPEEIKNDIIYNLKHGATLIDATGMYTNEGTAIIISVVNIRQIPEFLNIVKKHPDTFVYYSDVTGVKGNFRWNKEDEAK
ncbi:MAG: YitT family protein [Clostridiales bacterium]|nr:YitT family protein [Clostridiales bacterium]